ncbi:helix-turn-helix transcriptional regulator [Bifidobacterium aquikefiricola]|uniref:AraC family transcriptional regulator n=1 Tax=Bifidobacterium aquikefiricola TaxID=3059038 RepID=A0AB39U6P5_9BIFI
MNSSLIQYSLDPKKIAHPTLFVSCGLSGANAQHTHDPLNRGKNTNMIRLMLSGEDELYTSGMRFMLRRGNGFLTRPQSVEIQQSFSLHSCVFIWMSFADQLSEPLLQNIGLTHGHDVFFVRYPMQFLRLVVDCLSHTSGSVTDELELNAIAYHFLYLLSKEMTLESGMRIVAQSNPNINRVKEFILQHYSEQINIANISNALHSNRSYLSREFHKISGMTIKQYIDHIRITKATDLLLMSDISLESIAKQTGYRNVEVFADNFKRVHSMSPRNYRQLHDMQARVSNIPIDLETLRMVLGLSPSVPTE